MSETARTKVCYEELFDKFKTAARDWLQHTPEARSLLLLVDWRVGKEDFPPCALLGPEPTESSTVDMMRQTVKLLDNLSEIFRQQLNQATSALRQADEIIKQHQAQSKSET